jgi:hypothetical protein
MTINSEPGIETNSLGRGWSGWTLRQIVNVPLVSR